MDILQNLMMFPTLTCPCNYLASTSNLEYVLFEIWTFKLLPRAHHKEETAEHRKEMGRTYNHRSW